MRNAKAAVWARMRFFVLIPTHRRPSPQRRRDRRTPHARYFESSSLLTIMLSRDSMELGMHGTMPHCKLRPPESPIDHNKREESLAVADSSNMSITSKPIPIPQQQREDNHSHSNDNNELSSREAVEIYDAATWRMFELITSARLRAATANSYYLVDDRHTTAYTDDHHGAAVAAVGKSSQQQHPEGTRDRVYSLPEPPSSSSAPPSHRRSSLMEEMFPMDSL